MLCFETSYMNSMANHHSTGRLAAMPALNRVPGFESSQALEKPFVVL